MINFDECLDIAKSAASSAGEFLSRAQGQDVEILLNHGRDLKLQIDFDAEQMIIDQLKSKSSYSILGEETGLTEKLGDFYWVVDPLDGTSNFLRDIPISCVSIALMHQKESILGVIYDFNNDDLYFGHKESKAYLNDREIQVSSFSHKKDSTLVTGIPAKTHYSDDEFHKMILNFQSWKKIRMIGSAAMAAVYVASGKADAYQEDGIFLWDVAAGAAIVNAAGGMVSLKNLKADYRVDAIFSNNKITQ